jgi:hypothetical protein
MSFARWRHNRANRTTALTVALRDESSPTFRRIISEGKITKCGDHCHPLDKARRRSNYWCFSRQRFYLSSTRLFHSLLHSFGTCYIWHMAQLSLAHNGQNDACARQQWGICDEMQKQARAQFPMWYKWRQSCSLGVVQRHCHYNVTWLQPFKHNMAAELNLIW